MYYCVTRKEPSMGIYLNPGPNAFEEAYNSEIFVDKTEMIMHTNSVVRTRQKYISVSRPRRFGKSMAADMLCAYYEKNCASELFKKCKLSTRSDWDRYLGKFDVIRLVITDFLGESRSVDDMLQFMTEEVTAELSEAFPDVVFGSRVSLRTALSKIYAKLDHQFVIVIDEWDAIFRERKDDVEGQKKYLDFLRDWLKDKDYIALAYMTGILPIKKYGKHSALNMFSEYSMTGPMQLAPYTGFTEEEVAYLCDKYNISYKEIAQWYDGYTLSDVIPVDKRDEYREGLYDGHKISIYSPLSVVSAVSTGIIENYWNKTENYEALADYINRDFDGLKEITAVLMAGGRVKINIKKYSNDMTTFAGRDDILTLLIHLGYLGYDSDTSEVFIPNREILDEFKNSTDDKVWIDTFKSFKASQELLNAIWSGDEAKTAELIELTHDRAGNKTYNSEAALSYSIQYAMYAAQAYYTTIQELDTGKGYADIVYLPAPKYADKPAILMELKYDKDVQTVADQIRDRNYPQVLEHYKGNILLVSINYDKNAHGAEFKRHSCKIEKC